MNDQTRRGALYGAAAYALWGLFPLFWPLLDPASALEVLAHRVLWSLLVVAALLQAGRTWARVRVTRTQFLRLSVASVLLAVNWGTYIYGVDSGQVVETSLGYFVNPLVSVGLGVLVLGERLRAAQKLAIGVAALAVVVLSVASGQPPWLALVLAFSFGLYGLLKKQAGVGAVASLAVETAVLSPLAVAYVVVIGITGASTFSSHGVGHASLLATAGLVTAIVSGTLPETKTNLGRKVPNAGMAALDWATLFQLLGYVPHDHDHDHDHDGARRSRALPFYQARCGHMKGLAAGPAPTPARGPVGRPPGAPRHLVRDARHRTSPRASPGGAGALMRPNLTYAVKEHLDTEVRRTRRPAPPKRQPFTAADPCGARPGSTAPMAQHLLTFGSYWQPA